MHDGLKALRNASSHAQGRGVRSAQVGIFGFKRLQFAREHIIFIVRYFRNVFGIIFFCISVQHVGKFVEPFFRIHFFTSVYFCLIAPVAA